MKCLEKDRNRRYETATALATDVQRFLNDEQLQACPPSVWYRLRKFARRNRRALLGTTLVFAASVTAIVALAISNVRIRLERDEKEQALRDKAAALKAAEALGRVFQGRPETEAYHDNAVQAFEKLASLYPESAFYVANACGERVHLARMCVEKERYDDAEKHYRLARELADGFIARCPHQASEVVSAYGELATFCATCPDPKLRNPSQALELARKATDLAPNSSEAWLIRGRVQAALERWDSAVADFSKVIEIALPGDGNVAWAYGGRSYAYRGLKQLDKALADLNKATELWPNLFDAWAWRGWFHQDQQQWEKAAADFPKRLN